MTTNFHWSFENPRPMELVVNFGTNIDEKIREMKSGTIKIDDQ